MGRVSQPAHRAVRSPARRRRDGRLDIERFGADAASHWLVQPGAGVSARVTARDALFGEIDLRRIPDGSGDVTALRLLVGVRFDLR
jgi:hypothetical protein